MSHAHKGRQREALRKTLRARVLRCPVGLNPQVVHVETFDDLRRHCGDMNSRESPTITRLPPYGFVAQFDAWCDEDGEPKGLPLNLRMGNGYPVLGTLVLTKHDDRAEAMVGDLTDEEIAFLTKTVERWRR